jgi:sulfoxide reductase heme-binding subunit YedZ
MLDSNTSDQYLKIAVIVLMGILAMTLFAVAAVVVQSPLQGVIDRALNGVFAISSVQALWYITRAAGFVAYFLLWLSTAWGLAVTSKIFDPLLHRAFTYDMHQFISLLAIGFTFLHIAVLIGDRYLPFSIADILIPFIAPYRPIWVGVGVIGLYLTMLVTVTFYVRKWIGQKTFRLIHLASFLAYAGVTVHGLMSGTDSPLWTVQLMYGGTALVVVFLTIYWIMMVSLKKLETPTFQNTVNPRR